jgi:hypothetical protein
MNLTLAVPQFDDHTTWHKGGKQPDEYSFELREQAGPHGQTLISLQGLDPDPEQYATVYKWIPALDLRGQRLRISTLLRTTQVETYGSIWVRIDSEEGEFLAFDNMSDRLLKGDTDWTPVEIVLDVRFNASKIAFGLMLSGHGRVEATRFVFESVDLSVPSTDMLKKDPSLLGPRKEREEKRNWHSLRVGMREIADHRTYWLPPIHLRVAHAEVAGETLPADVMGGDLHTIRRLPDGRLLVFLVDVAGHGLRASLVSAMCRGIVLQWATRPDGSAGELVTCLNAAIREFTRSPRLVASTCILLLDPVTGFWNCRLNGTPPPQCITQDGTINPLVCDSDLPLGSFSNARSQHHQGRLQPGDRICLFSDGFSEAPGDDDQPFGDDALLELLRSTYPEDAISTLAQIQARLNAHSGERPRDDDQTLIVVDFGRR